MEPVYAILAQAFRYPAPPQLERLQSGLADLPSGKAKKSLTDFVDQIRQLSLGEWEELYTHTLDLSPLVTPYIGFQIWGEGYQRGNFLARLNRAMSDARIDLDGELPDHLVPVLRYLAVTDEPLPDLLEVLQPAIEAMHKALKKSGPGNPYLQLLEAAAQAFQSLPATSGEPK